MIQEIKLRRSIRKYLDKPVEEEKLLNLMESAGLAPSGSNKQPWHFIIIRDPAVKKEAVRAANGQSWMLTAPVLIACVADISLRIGTGTDIEVDEESPQRDLKQAIRDTAIAAEHIVLEAVHQGLGTCWVAWFNQNEIRPVLKLPKEKYVLAVLTVGYPSEEPKERGRRDLKDIIRFDTW